MNDEFSLFNSMDDGLLTQDDRAFEESLALNVLFQEKILVPETNFFNCTHLIRHMTRVPGRQSLFEAACKRGIIVPALRNPAAKSLDEATGLFGEVYGYDIINPLLVQLKHRIIASVDEGIHSGTTHPFYWPSDRPLGKGYERVVQQLLQLEEPPEYTQHDVFRAHHFSLLWDRTKRWRFDLIDQALRRTMAKGALGLQRSEICNLLGWSLGISRNIERITPDMLLMTCNNDEEKLLVIVFQRWVSQCHYLNFARNFEVSINFPLYNLDQDFVLDSVLRSPADLPPTDSERGFRCEVKLPEFSGLARSDPSDLIAIRSELGHGYMHALRKWQTDPTETHQAAVEGILKEYCNNISYRYAASPTNRLDVSFSSGRFMTRARPFIDVGAKALELLPLYRTIKQWGEVVFKIVKVVCSTAVHEEPKELEITTARDVEAITPNYIQPNTLDVPV